MEHDEVDKTNHCLEELTNSVTNMERILVKLEPHEEQGIFNKLYLNTIKFIKYIGLPALILGSIIPVQELLEDLRDKVAQDLLIKLSTHKANALADSGEFARAQNILDFMIEEEKNGYQLYFPKLKLYTKQAISGEECCDQRTAEDLLIILIDLKRAYEQRYFMSGFGESDDYARFVILLGELKLAQSKYEDVISLEELKIETVAMLKIHLEMIFSEALINLSRTVEAKKKLASACKTFAGIKANNKVNNITFKYRIDDEYKIDEQLLEKLSSLVNDVNDSAWKNTLPIVCQ